VIVRPLGLALLAALIPCVGFVVPIWFVPLVDAFLFGLLLAGYLAWRHDVGSIFQLAGVVVVSVIAFVAALMFVLPLLGVVEAMAHSSDGMGELAVSRGMGPVGALVFGIGSALGAAIVAFGFLVVVPGNRISREMFGQIGVTAAAAGTLMFVGAFASRPSDMTLPIVMFVMWHSAVAFVLAIQSEALRDADHDVEAAELKPNLDPASPPVPSQVLAAAPNGSRQMLIVLAALVGLYVVHSVTMRVIANGYMERENAKHERWLTEAPSGDNLPPLHQQPLGETFVATVGTMTLQGEGHVRRDQAPPGSSPGRAQSPDFLTYSGHYSNALSEGSITIWQYPTKDWARYETRHLIGMATSPAGDQFILNGGNDEYYWFSDDKMIRVTGPRPSVDALLSTYLKKYPSDVDAAFPLFNGQRHQ